MNQSFKLIDCLAPFQAGKLTDNSLLIKGFASVALVDREQDLVYPEEFDVATFMNSPTLLFNHDFIKNREGNSEVSGSVKLAVPAYIAGDDVLNEENWVVKSIRSDEFVSTWPKHKSPNMREGDQGLFVAAEVTHPMVIKQIESGEAGAFSWRGFSALQDMDNGVTLLKAIDLIEISVVNMAGNAQATFLVTDEEDPELNREISMKNLLVQQIKFDKTDYNYNQILEYTKKLNIDQPILSETDESFFVGCGDSSKVKSEKTFSFRVGNLNLVATHKSIDEETLNICHVGRMNSTLNTEIQMNENAPVEKVAEETVDLVETNEVECVKFYLVDADTVKSHFPNAKTELQKQTVLEEIPVEIHTLQLEAVKSVESTEVEEETTEEVVAEEAAEVVTEEVITEEVSKDAEAVTEATEEVTEEASEEVVAEETTEEVEVVAEESTETVEEVVAEESKIDELLESVKTLLALHNAEADARKSAEEKAKSLEETLEAKEEERSQIEKQLSEMKTAIPSQDVREEKVEAAKSAATSDIFASFKRVKS